MKPAEAVLSQRVTTGNNGDHYWECRMIINFQAVFHLL